MWSRWNAILLARLRNIDGGLGIDLSAGLEAKRRERWFAKSSAGPMHYTTLTSPWIDIIVTGLHEEMVLHYAPQIAERT